MRTMKITMALVCCFLQSSHGFVRSRAFLFRTPIRSLLACSNIDPKKVDSIGGYPGIVLQYNEQQELVHPDLERVMSFCQSHELTDLCVTVHGWLTNTEDAIDRYNVQYEKIKNQTNHRLQDRNIGIMGVLWPANLHECTGQDCEIIVKQLDAMEAGGIVVSAFKLAVKAVIALKDNLDETENAREAVKVATIDFMDAISDGEDSSMSEITKATSHLLSALDDVAEDQLKGWLENLLAQIASLLDTTTYFEMMERSRELGAKSLTKLFRSIKEECPELNIHLTGNSFGALAVTAAANNSKPNSFASMTLLQGAFSHNAFAKYVPGMMKDVPVLQDMEDKPPGEYYRVIDERVVSGPIVVTYTDQDDLLNLPYALAARFQGNTGLIWSSMMVEENLQLGIGGPDDEYGAMGRNGAQNLELIHELELKESAPSDRQTYELSKTKVNNVNGSKVIESHTDIRTDNIADLLIEVIDSTKVQTKNESVAGQSSREKVTR